MALAVSAHMIYYMYLYRRNLWLKPLVSNTVWAMRNGVRKALVRQHLTA